MKNAIKSGHVATFAHTSAVVSGQPIDMGNGKVGVACGAYDANESGEYATSGVHSFAKEAATAMASFEAVGYDEGNANVVDSADATKDFDIGTVFVAALAADATVQILVNNQPGPMSY